MLEWFQILHSPEGISQIIATGGLLLLIGIIFAETGLLIGFFLPGDSLLITAGVLSNPQNLHHIDGLNIGSLIIFLSLAAVVGDQVGFFLGNKTGDKIWNKPDGRFYKRRYLDEAHAFYEKYGGFAIVGARFVPILRTFVPFAAGLAKMRYRNFVFWNIFGGILWVPGLCLLGFYLGETQFANRLDKIIALVILVSIIPLVFGVVKKMIKR